MVNKKKVDTIDYQKEIEKKAKGEFDNLTPQEQKLLRNLRNLNKMEITGKPKEIWLRMDESKVTVEQAKFFISTRLNKIREIKLEIDNNKIQIAADDVWRHRDGYPNVKLKKVELECEIEKLKLGIDQELSGIRSNIIQIIPFIATIGLDRQQIITHDQFNDYIFYIEETVKKLCNKNLF